MPRACGRPAPAPGRLELEWSGLRQGRISTPAEAHWCPGRGRLALTVVRGDTGIGVAVFGAHDLAGDFTILPRDQADSTRPHAALAIRWVDSTAVPAFEGSAGEVRLNREPSGRLDGRIEGSLKPLVGAGSVVVRGRLVSVPVVTERCAS